MPNDLHPGPSAGTAESQPRKRRFRVLGRQIIEIGLLVAILYVGMSFTMQTVRVEGTSMVPTLQDQDLLFADKLTYHFRDPQRGDIIIFTEHGEGVGGSDRYLIKRIIAVPGDQVEMNTAYKDPRYEFAPPRPVVLVKPGGKGPWQRLDEPYLQNTWDGGPNDTCCTPTGGVSGTPAAATVPKDTFFVLGDNRDNSRDSRFIGFIQRKDILGRAIFRILPFGTWGGIGDTPILQNA